MYGLVNKAIEDLAVSLVGHDGWLDIAGRAGVDNVSFVSLDSYDDGVTYRLVGAASEVLGLSPEQVLEAFGEYWVLYTGREGYGSMLTAYGNDVATFLRNLDTMHARVGLMMPDLRPPQFDVEDVEQDVHVIHYRSTREGLGPMVVGLLKGVGRLFGQDVAVERLDRKEQGADHDSFRVAVLGPLATAHATGQDGQAVPDGAAAPTPAAGA